MAVLDIRHSAATPGSSLLSRLVARSISSFLVWNDTRRTAKALSQLSAHELDDIGLSRSDIASMTRR